MVANGLGTSDGDDEENGDGAAELPVGVLEGGTVAGMGVCNVVELGACVVGVLVGARVVGALGVAVGVCESSVGPEGAVVGLPPPPPVTVGVLVDVSVGVLVGVPVGVPVGVAVGERVVG